jgi:beta-lactamase superfamily II metal-dependent hydrolase
VRGTNSENNSSVVTLVDFGSERLLFTGDAGVPALEVACKVAEWNSIPLQDFSFVQIPHHGSKRNVSPDILNRLIGHPSPAGTKQFRAMASVPATGEPKHPSRRVLNAFKRRGADVFLTQGKGVCLKSKQAPPRAGWVTVTAQPFFEEVESDESD